MIKAWMLLTVLAACVQAAFGVKKINHLAGMILPAGFLAFGIYAFSQLLKVGIEVNVLLAFMIPPVFLASLFELTYWRSRFKEQAAAQE